MWKIALNAWTSVWKMTSTNKTEGDGVSYGVSLHVYCTLRLFIRFSFLDYFTHFLWIPICDFVFSHLIYLVCYELDNKSSS